MVVKELLWKSSGGSDSCCKVGTSACCRIAILKYILGGGMVVLVVMVGL